MLTQITGLHHVTSLASDAARNNAFFTGTLGLRRVKKTVNFDAPDVYHLYYADEIGTPGTVMTYFPFPNAGPGRRGTGEAGLTAFAIPKGARARWADRLREAGAANVAEDTRFGEDRLTFDGPDGEALALVEADDDREPWTGGGVDADIAIRGFHHVELTLRDTDPTAGLLRLMGFDETARDGDMVRMDRGTGPGGLVHLTASDAAPAAQGAGSVHHVAFGVKTHDDHEAVRTALLDADYQVTPVIDRDYFHAIYFRSPGGVLFEVATAEPGFARDEDPDHLGEALKLPDQHEHLRDRLERSLQPIDGDARAA